MQSQDEILDPFYLDKLVKWEKITDEILLLDVEVKRIQQLLEVNNFQIQKLRIQKNENKEMFELYRNPGKIKGNFSLDFEDVLNSVITDKNQLLALGKHFVKMNTKEAYKELELSN